jgi:transposase
MSDTQARRRVVVRTLRPARSQWPPATRPRGSTARSGCDLLQRMANKSYREWMVGQPLLLSPDVRRWLPDDHLVWFVIDLVGQLDLSDIEAQLQAKDGRGTRPFDPKMMMALLMYAYAVGVFSSRKIERASYEDLAFRVLLADNHPDHDTIATFRRQHLLRFHQLFVEVLRTAAQMGLVQFGLLGLDGTKVLAAASKHKAMSYERMNQEIARLQKEIEQLSARAEHVDVEEDARYGDGTMADLPAELARREERLARIRAAKEALEAEAKAARAEQLRQQAADLEAKAADEAVEPKQRKTAATLAKNRRAAADELDGGPSDDDDAPPPTDGPQPSPVPEHTVKHRPDGKPDAKAQRNFTDPDSRIMVSGGQYVQSYNAHAMVDSKAQLIVATAVGNQAPDTDYLPPMVQRTVENAHAIGMSLPEHCPMVADTGFWSPDNVQAAKAAGMDPFIATERVKHGAPPPTPPQDTAAAPDGVQDGVPPPEPAPPPTPREQMRQKLRTPEGKQVYARRKVLPEPVFGQIKGARGFRRFLLRGIERVRAEWDLVCLTHNLLKMWRSGRALPALA